MVAVLFPGQGSQYVGMGKFLLDDFSYVAEVFDEASDSLSQNMRKLCLEGPESQLQITENTQPSLLVVSYALYKVLENEFNIKPSFAAGHSLGEYSALCAARSISFGDAILAVKQRSRFMQEAVPLGEGSMMAVLGLTEEEVRKLCDWSCGHFQLGPLELANFNSPGQIVVSGNKKLIDQLINTEIDWETVFGQKMRFRLIPLNVSAPFHCSMMKPAQEKMALILNGLNIKNPSFPVIQNVNALATQNISEIRKNLIEQMSGPVMWMQSINELKSRGCRKLIECGPGRVLSGLVKKIDSDLVTMNIQSTEDIRKFEKEPQWHA